MNIGILLNWFRKIPNKLIAVNVRLALRGFSIIFV